MQCWIGFGRLFFKAPPRSKGQKETWGSEKAWYNLIASTGREKGRERDRERAISVDSNNLFLIDDGSRVLLQELVSPNQEPL